MDSLRSLRCVNLAAQVRVLTSGKHELIYSSLLIYQLSDNKLNRRFLLDFNCFVLSIIALLRFVCFDTFMLKGTL